MLANPLVCVCVCVCVCVNKDGYVIGLQIVRQ
jgi:hypothetical protein